MLYRAARSSPFFGEVRIDPLAEPGFLVAPLQAFADDDRADPAAAHGDAVAGQVGDQPVQGPRREGKAQFGRAGQRRGDDGAALLGRIGRRPSRAHVLLQPVHAAGVEAVQPVPHRVGAQVHPGTDLGRLQAVHGMHDDLGASHQPGSQRVGARDPLHRHPLILAQLPQSKSHRPAPRQIWMTPQQQPDRRISGHLPDAPLRASVCPRSSQAASERGEKRPRAMPSSRNPMRALGFLLMPTSGTRALVQPTMRSSIAGVPQGSASRRIAISPMPSSRLSGPIPRSAGRTGCSISNETSNIPCRPRVSALTLKETGNVRHPLL